MNHKHVLWICCWWLVRYWIKGVVADVHYVTSCFTVSSGNGLDFVLQNNINHTDSTTPCIVMDGATEVTFNGGGFEINTSFSVPNYSLFSVLNSVGVTISNLQLSGGGIRASGQDFIFETITATGCNQCLESTGFQNATITNSHFDGVGNTVMINGGTLVSISSCSIISNGYSALWLSQIADLTVDQNEITVSGPETSGLYTSSISANFLVTNNEVTTAAGASGITLQCDGAAVTADNNYVMGLNVKSGSCGLSTYGFKIVGCSGTGYNNTAENIGFLMQSTIVCAYAPVYGGFYIEQSNITLDLLKASLVQNATYPRTSSGSMMSGFPNAFFGVYIVNSYDVTLRQAMLTNIHAPNQLAVADLSNANGFSAVAVYIGGGNNQTNLHDITVYSLQGGNAAMVYKPTGSNGYYNTTGGTAIAVFFTSGNAFFNQSNVTEVRGGDGYTVEGYAGITNCGGGAVDVVVLTPHGGLLSSAGSHTMGYLYPGVSCAYPTNNNMVITACGTYPALLNGNIYLGSDLDMVETGCVIVTYAKNITFNGNGYSIQCTIAPGICATYYAILFQETNMVGLVGLKIYDSGVKIASSTVVSGVGNSLFVNGRTSINFPQSSNLMYSNYNTFINCSIGVLVASVLQYKAIGNTFEGNINFAISSNADSSVIESNTVLNSIQTAFYASSSHVEYTNNVVRGGHYYTSPIGAFALFSGKIFNNTVEDVSTNQNDVIRVQCSFTPGQVGVEVSNNTVRNIMIGCTSFAYGISVTYCTANVTDNIVYNFFPTADAAVLDACTTQPVVAAFMASNSTVLYAQNTAFNFHTIATPKGRGQVSFPGRVLVDPTVLGILVDGSTVKVENCNFYDFYGENTADCANCSNANAFGVAGIALYNTTHYYSSLSVSKSTFRNFQAGNGGNIAAPKTISSTANGGNSFGIFNPLPTLNYVEIRDSNFSDFIAGHGAQAGNLHCLDGCAKIGVNYNTGLSNFSGICIDNLAVVATATTDGFTLHMLGSSFLSSHLITVLVGPSRIPCSNLVATFNTSMSCTLSEYSVGGKLNLLVYTGCSLGQQAEIDVTFIGTLPNPTITSITKVGTQGGLITVTGSEFVGSSNQTKLTIGGVSCTGIVVLNMNTFTCTIGPGTGSNLLTNLTIVTVNYNTNLSPYLQPVITSISKVNTEGGVIIVNGSNFGNAIGSLALTFGSAPRFTCSNFGILVPHISVNCTLAPGVGFDFHTFINVSGQISPMFTASPYKVPEVLAATRPLFAGGSVTITGQSFGNNVSLISVLAGKQVCSTITLLVPHTKLQCSVGPGTGIGTTYAETHIRIEISDHPNTDTNQFFRYQASRCSQNHGNCDPRTSCNDETGSVVCGPCPVGTNGTGATGCLSLCGDGYCNETAGENCLTCLKDCSNKTSCGKCGDLVCEISFNETCKTCFEDCGPCVTPTCPSNCNGHGTCKDGVCMCDNLWTGPSCSTGGNSNITVGVGNKPTATVGTTTNVNFVVSITSLEEVDNSGVVKRSVSVPDLRFTLSNSTYCKNNYYNYTVELQFGAILTIFLYQFEEPITQFGFANTTYNFTQHTLKLSVQISDWPFQALTNTLHVNMDSILAQQKGCVSNATDESGSLRWFTAVVGDVSLYGQFLDKAEVDGRVRTITYLLNADNTVTAVIPHFWDVATMDPHYSVLLGDEDAEACLKNDKVSKSVQLKLVIPLVVGIVLIVVVFAFVVGPRIHLWWKLHNAKKVPSTVELSTQQQPVTQI